jgi:transposase-like protein
LIQRCQVHKKRNVRDHLPRKHVAELSRQLNAAYQETDYDRALKGLKTTARWLDGDMRQRWCTAWPLRAESKFRRVTGHRHMPQLLQALDRLILEKGLDEYRKVA